MCMSCQRFFFQFQRIQELFPDRLRLPAGLLFFGCFWNISRFCSTLMAIVLRDWHLILFFLSLWVAAAVMFAQVGGERKQYMVSITGVNQKGKNYALFSMAKYKRNVVLKTMQKSLKCNFFPPITNITHLHFF